MYAFQRVTVVVIVVCSFVVVALAAAGCGSEDPAEGFPGPCDVVDCDEVPKSECVGDFTLRIFEGPGSCVDGECIFESEEMSCGRGCEDGECVGDPCAGVYCNNPPEDSCVDEDTLEVYEEWGDCAEGDCSYISNEITCDHGCSDGECVAPECESNEDCTDPPGPCYESSGICEEGQCHYDQLEDDAHCEDDNPCNLIGRCEGGECTIAVPADCSVFDGPCVVGRCEESTGECYPETVDDGNTCYDGDACTEAGICDDGVCQTEPVECDEPPEDECVDGETLRVYVDSGVCDGDDGSCVYDHNDEDCSPGTCSEGECQAGAL